MKTLKFKTNLKCNGCISAITPAMNNIQGIASWKVDLASPERLLTVECDPEKTDEILDGIRKAGYEIELIR